MNLISKLIFVIANIFILLALSMFIVASEYKIFNYSLVGISILLYALFVFLNFKSLIKIFKSNLFRNVVSHSTMIFLSICIFGMVNYFVFKNDYSIDFTKAKYHSLSSQSQKVMKDLCGSNDEIKMTLFARRSDWSRFLKLINLYKKQCSTISIDAIDVEQNPALVSINNIKENGTLLVEINGKKFFEVASSEQILTTFFSKIANPKTYILYYVIGHNESSLDDSTAQGYSYLKEKISNSNYRLKALDLSQGIPKDADALLILDPKLPFLEKEIERLDDFIKSDGSLILTKSPNFSEFNLELLNEFLFLKGVKFENALILDRLSTQQGGQASIPIVNTYDKTHPITQDMKGRTLFPISGYFSKTMMGERKWSSLAQSTNFPASWGETDFNEVKTGKATYDEGIDAKGPLDIFLVSEHKKSRIAVFASSTFISNQYQNQSNNFNIFLNSLSWVINDERMISLDRPELNQNLVYVSDIHFSFVFYFVILIFPFIFFGIGIFVYRKRMSQ